MTTFPYKIKFPPGAVDGMLAMALQTVLGYSSPQYHYDRSGSTVEFTPTQLKALVVELNSMKRAAKEDPEAYGEMLPEIEEALETVRKAVMESDNIAQASRYDDLVKKCEQYCDLAILKS